MNEFFCLKETIYVLVNLVISPISYHSSSISLFCSPSHSVAFIHFLSEINRRKFLPFGDFRSINFTSKQGTHPLCLFKVNKSSVFRSLSPTLTSNFLSILYHVTIIRDPIQIFPHLINIIIESSLHHSSFSLHNSNNLSPILILIAFLIIILHLFSSFQSILSYLH